MKYYTTEELAAETQKLIKQNKPLWAMADDPKCPPDVAAKLRQLRNLMTNSGKEHNDGR